MASDLKIGRDFALKIGGITYKSRDVASGLETEKADATASGDKISVRIPIRLTGDVTGRVLTNDTANLVGIVGSVMTCYIMDGSTTAIGPFDAEVSATLAADINGMAEFAVTLSPQAVPPQYTAIGSL